MRHRAGFAFAFRTPPRGYTTIFYDVCARSPLRSSGLKTLLINLGHHCLVSEIDRIRYLIRLCRAPRPCNVILVITSTTACSRSNSALRLPRIHQARAPQEGPCSSTDKRMHQAQCGLKVRPVQKATPTQRAPARPLAIHLASHLASWILIPSLIIVAVPSVCGLGVSPPSTIAFDLGIELETDTWRV